jgi:hypothetical protein
LAEARATLARLVLRAAERDPQLGENCCHDSSSRTRNRALAITISRFNQNVARRASMKENAAAHGAIGGLATPIEFEMTLFSQKLRRVPLHLYAGGGCSERFCGN